MPSRRHAELPIWQPTAGEGQRFDPHHRGETATMPTGLRATVRTGYLCVYAPDPTHALRWEF